MDQPLALPPPAAPESSDAARKPRHTEWTRTKMVAFLRELAASQSVHHAARSVGMSRQSAYRLRNRLARTPFALAWEVALESGLQQLAHAAVDRALNGVERPHYYHGELVGTSRHYDNRLTAWLLANPWKVGRHQAARELAGDTWDVLLEQIEAHGPGWLPDGVAPNREHVAAEYEERADELLELTHERWYEAHPDFPARAGRKPGS
jgi:hypothetical protein